MNEIEISVPDVLDDHDKNFNNLYSYDVEDEEIPKVYDSLYYTETETANLFITKNYNNAENLTILSLNIANLFSKLTSFKVFLNNINTEKNMIDIIVIVETHINDRINAGYSSEELKSILPGYTFYHKGRQVKKGGGVGILIRKGLTNEAEIIEGKKTGIKFVEETFENIVVKIPKMVGSKVNGIKKDLVVCAVYRQPNNDNFNDFNENLNKMIKTLDKKRMKLS